MTRNAGKALVLGFGLTVLAAPMPVFAEQADAAETEDSSTSDGLRNYQLSYGLHNTGVSYQSS